MNKLLSILALATLTIFLAACNETTNTSNEIPAALEVSVEVPTEVAIGETIEFLAVVKQDAELVSDADEVLFEIREVSGTDKQMIEASFVDKKGYAISYTFEKAGTYEVIPHTTARSQHVMPTYTLKVQ